MTDEELVRLARGLGWEVDAGWIFKPIDQPLSWLLTWEGLGAVVEAMRGKGWGVSLHDAKFGDGAGHWEIEFYARFHHWGHLVPYHEDIWADTAPEAVAGAALAALEGGAG